MPGHPRTGSDQDFYEVLGVPRTASQDEIQRAYRRLARAYHPDVNHDPGAEDRFKDVSEAYDVLSDPQTRRRYDTFGRDFRQVPDDADPETWRRTSGGARAGRARTGAGPGPGGFGDGGAFRDAGGFGFRSGDVDFEDLLGGLFGGRAGRGWGPVAGADQEAELEVSLEEAYRGTRRSITVAGDGTTRTLEVRVPAGVTSGQRIRLAGQGGRGSDGAPSGDLYLIVRIEPDARYRVDGRDVTMELRLAPWEAALGTSIVVELPDDEAKVKVPAGSSSGRRIRLRGRGLPNPNGPPGDLYAEVMIMVPRRLARAERRLFEQLAEESHFNPRGRS
jgi:curved DNA-binding protein